MTYSHSIDEKISKSSAIHHTISGMGGNLLIPVDFSDSSLLAVKVGLRLAANLGMSPVILHAYPEVFLLEDNSLPYFDQFAGAEKDIQAAIEQKDLLKLAKLNMEKFKKKIRIAQDNGEMNDVPFSTVLLEGIVERVILNYTKENTPRLVVMATRGIHQKHSDLIGSVTAEVLDNCRVPVLTVPDNFQLPDNTDIKNILMFCTLEPYDVVALEKMMHTFNNQDVNVWLMPVEGRKFNETVRQMNDLYALMSKRVPNASFHIMQVEKDGITPELDNILRKEGIQMLIAPNKKKGIFTNLFSPSVAHRCLFAIDLLMLALPV